MRNHAIGLRQRTARWHQVIEHKTALVHFGQKIRTGEAEASIRNYDEPGTEKRQKNRSLQRAAEPAFMKIHHSQEKSAEMRLFRRQQFGRIGIAFHASSLALPIRIFRGRERVLAMLAADEKLAQVGSPAQRQQKRRQQRNRHGHRQRPEKNTGDTGDRNQRDKYHDGRDGRADQRNRDFL